jgi:hypothetical protein
MNTPEPAPARSSPGSSPQARFRRIARFVRALILTGVFLLLLNTVVAWFAPSYAAQLIKTETEVDILGPLTLQTRVLFALWDLLTSAVLLAALYHLWQLFGEYLHARVFGVRALASLRGFARWMLVAAAASPILRAVLSVIGTWQNGPGHRQIVLNLSSDDYMKLLFGVVILAISSVMAEAARIAEDNEGFV